MKFLDVRTCDFNGELKCEFYGEDPFNSSTGVGGWIFYYSPVTDTLQLINRITGLELAGGSAIPAGVTSDTVIMHCVVNRTTTQG